MRPQLVTNISLFRQSKVMFFVRMTEEGSQFDIEAKASGGKSDQLS